jgi:hypothetical protein
MSTRDEEEAQAASWLRAQGYIPSRPNWLPPGKNPDFWAESATVTPPQLWAEVKSIGPNDSTAALTKFSSVIGNAQIPEGLRGHAMMHLDPYAVHQSVQWSLTRFKTSSKPFAGKKITLMFVQKTKQAKKEYRVEMDGEVPLVVWARADELPFNFANRISFDMLHANACVHAPDGTKMIGPAYKFFDTQLPLQCALVVRLDPQDKVLDRINLMSSGIGQTRERTARVLKDANAQIKAACATQRAPGIVILAPRGPFNDEDQMMQAAIYGQFTVPLRIHDAGIDHGDMYHGSDGVFRPNKNTHVSAAVHVRPNGPATFFPNPYALLPISDDAPLFAGAVRANVSFE